MASLAKPGAKVFAGAVVGDINVGEFGKIYPGWWAEMAKSDEFG